MKQREMNIIMVDLKSETNKIWYKDEKFDLALGKLMECGKAVQCTYEDNIVLRSSAGEAIFDKNGKLQELYDYQSQFKENIANRPESKDLEFEMILMLSKINE